MATPPRPAVAHLTHDPTDRLTLSPAHSYAYDLDGNQTEIWDAAHTTKLATLEWDALNRLARYTTWSGGTPTDITTYTYDPYARRLTKARDTDADGTAEWTTGYLWSGDELTAEYGATARQVRYEYAGGFAPVRVAYGPQNGETAYDVHVDGLGTPRLLTDESQAVVWRAAYGAYGEAFVEPGSAVAFDVRLPGQYFDEETGLHYNRFRYYDPSIGRYISADPIGQLGGPNLYAYALNDPVNGMDPTGEVTVRDVANFSAGLGDALLLGTSAAARDDDGFVDPCSDAYRYGSYAALAAGAARLGYAVAAKAGAAAAATGVAAHAFRNTLKSVARAGVARGYRSTSYGKALARYGSDEAVKAAAGRTNTAINAYGAGVTAAGTAGASECDCRE